MGGWWVWGGDGGVGWSEVVDGWVEGYGLQPLTDHNVVADLSRRLFELLDASVASITQVSHKYRMAHAWHTYGTRMAHVCR